MRYVFCFCLFVSLLMAAPGCEKADPCKCDKPCPCKGRGAACDSCPGGVCPPNYIPGGDTSFRSQTGIRTRGE